MSRRFLSLEYLTGKCKKLEDGNYYAFRVYTKVVGDKKNKKMHMFFKAKQAVGKSHLDYTYVLPKFTTHTDSLITVANLLIEYCFLLNKNYELYIDKELYKVSCSFDDTSRMFGISTEMSSTSCSSRT